LKEYRTDYHVHPNYSIDAMPATIRQYSQRAIELKLDEICFTTHVELDPARDDGFVYLNGVIHPASQLEWLDSYFKEINEAQEEFQNESLIIRTGLEIGYVPGIERKIQNIIDDYPIDFVLGAVHTLDNSNISSKSDSPEYFSRKSLSQMRNEYFTALENAVDCGLFHCIAHIDLYRRYGFEYYGAEVFTAHRGVLEPILEKIASSNMGIEINTSSLRRNSKEFYPSDEIFKMAVDAGVKIFTVGSDAHCLEHLGLNIDDAIGMLDEHGFKSTIYRKGKPINISDMDF